jgi:hypothetical protein
MAVIRDNEMFGLAMIPLFCDWNIRRCNVKDCTEKPTTIITQVIDCAFGLCENHYKEVVSKGEYDFTLVFDEFDSFTQPNIACSGLEAGAAESGQVLTSPASSH